MIVVGIIIILIIWAAIEQKQLVTARYDITSERLPEKLNSTSFVVLADLHNYNFGRNNERLRKKIEELSPEFIIVAGDMINKNTVCYPSNAFNLLEALAKKYKIYYAYGNHEQKMELIGKTVSGINLTEAAKTEDEKYIKKVKTLQEAYSSWVEYKNKLLDLKIIFLDNTDTSFFKNNTKLAITGVSIGPQYFKRGYIPEMEKDYLHSLIRENDKKNFQILIAHNPVYFIDYANWGADLTISGHLHGGLVRIPGVGGVLSPQAKFFPKYHSGNFTENGQQMVVSRGLGSHSVMPRLFNIPEIVFITLKTRN